MARYVAIQRPRAWSSAHEVPEDRPNCTVFEVEGAPRDTGIYDASGVKLYAVEDREPIGFRVKR